MPTYLTPGVYIEEMPSASKPIEGVGTSTAAFVGLAPGGPVNTPIRISNWSQFARIFGDPETPANGPFVDGAYLAHAVYGFFLNGGGLCWVVRVGAEGGGQVARAALPAATDKDVEAYRVVALEGVSEPIKVEVQEEPSTAEGASEDKTFTLIVTAGAAEERFEGLSQKKGRQNIATRVSSASKLIKIELTGESLPDAQRLPAPGNYTLSGPPRSISKVGAGEFEGDVAERTGMGGFAAVDEITMIVMPDLMSLKQNGDDSALRDVQGKMIAHCENMGDRMALIDTPPDLRPQDVLEWRSDVAGYDSKMAALYWPWIEVMDPITRRPIMVPPSGHMAGVWARTDARRGVHKAPANEVVMGAIGLAFQVTGAEQGALNQVGINCIRSFRNRGNRVWGARTLSSDPEWRYINVRRLFNYVAESIVTGTQWSVFEPNDQRLWMQLKIAATNFLMRVWRSGALFGATPEQAFYVKCDEETNPPEVIEAGQVVCEIGIAPVKPAEFVVFRLSQFTGGGGEAEVEE
jgi:phage tail sheath protein FI